MASDSTPGFGTPFTQAMGQARTAAEDLAKMFSDMKWPAVPGMEPLLNAHRRNLEAMTAANRIALEGFQAVTKRQMEILQQAAAEMTEHMRALATAEDPQTKVTRQAEQIKVTYERAVANLHELGDIVQRSNSEALGLLNKRFTDAMDEVKLLVDKSKPV